MKDLLGITNHKLHATPARAADELTLGGAGAFLEAALAPGGPGREMVQPHHALQGSGRHQGGLKFCNMQHDISKKNTSR